MSIATGGQVEKDPSDWYVRQFNWDSHITAGAELTSAAEQAASFTITDVTIPESSRESTPTLEIDEITFVSGSGNRKVNFRVKGGAVGHVYRISHSIETNEQPSQKRERSYYEVVTDK